MKEFENDNWELKARQLADAFQPTPDKSVWLNVEDALKQKKNHRVLFFWLFSIVGVAVVVYGGVTLYLLNAGDQYETLNKQVEKSKVETVAVNNNSSEVVKTVPAVPAQKTEQVAAVKTITENFPLKNEQRKVIPLNKQAEIVELKTVVKKNELEEKPDIIVNEKTAVLFPMAPKPLQACSFAFRDAPVISFPSADILSSNYRGKKRRISLLISSSYLMQHSILNSTDTLQSFQKQNANYIDGSLQLIYQFPKAKNLELNFGLGFYELNQNYTSSKVETVSVFDTTSGIPLVSADKFTDYTTGSEFSRNTFVDFGIGIPIIACKNFSWNISTGIRTEYLMRYSASSGATIPNTFANLGVQNMESISSNELNRFYVKGMLITSIRYSLSKHFALQSGINSSYAITEGYKKSSSLHQRDLNFGVNAGVIYRF